MKKFEKINNIAFAALFGAIGLTALIAAMFFGAVHQLGIAGVCAMMAWAR